MASICAGLWVSNFMASNKTKAELTEELVAEAVSAGKKAQLESVDFSDPNRPLTCLEVDFPILPINQIAQIEGNAGKPIYQMSKWWARRRSSVFRSMLIAAATKAPDEPSESAKLVWDNYYANHQDNQAFRQLKVADIFMGGGTTLVEGVRLGMQMTGNDLNPVAWLVVKNELADVDLDEVNKLFDHVEREVKPQVMPFYACEGPNGEKGKWTQRSTGKVLGDDFDPLTLTPEERKDYAYEGPEVIYTFWAKHGPCAAPDCGHRTPLMTSPVVAVKSLSVKTWQDVECQRCGSSFDLECQEARMAPDVPLVVSESEAPYAIMDDDGHYQCPHCQHHHRDEAAAQKGESSRLLKKMTKNKTIKLSLIVDEPWMKGAHNAKTGGTCNSDSSSTEQWYLSRTNTSYLFEIRGDIPESIYSPLSGKKFSLLEGNVPKAAHFICQGDTCGQLNSVLNAVKKSGDTAPFASYLVSCFSPRRKAEKKPYNGRFFNQINDAIVSSLIAAENEWERRKDSDLAGYWPKEHIPIGAEIGIHDVEGHHYNQWWKMFNSRQLLTHALLLKSIDDAHGYSENVKNILIGCFQQYLRNQNMFCFWNKDADKMEPLFSDNHFHPKPTSIENSVFSELGRGNWASCRNNTIKALEWRENPWELVANERLKNNHPEYSTYFTGKSSKALTKDPVLSGARLINGSATELESVGTNSIDLVITDPPFSELVQYAELSDFFYAWLKIPLSKKYSDIYSSDLTPKSLEAVANKARHPEDPNAFYKRLLTGAWTEAHRVLKPSGILAFTFHHSEDDPWVDVLESLFQAGFYLQATYPIRGDETKGDQQFGSKKVEYDIIHVCRKRTEAPSKISWARLRRKILEDVRQLQGLLEHHQSAGLPVADIQVIKRGKALEYFSRHYGQVYVEEGREFTINEALVGINQILDDQSESESGGTPVVCEPNTRQFLRIFARQPSIERDQMQKFLRGSGIAPSTFVALGWATETTRPKAFHWRSPLEFAQERMASNRSVSRDFDQAMLLVGACYPESGINTKKILNEDFKPHPALGNLLDWLVHNGADSSMRNACTLARQLFNRWEADHQQIMQAQISLFGMEDEV